MNPTDATGDRVPVMVYQARGHIGWQAAGFLIGGILFFLMLLFRFVLLLGDTKRHAGNDSAPGIIGGTSVIGFALVARGIYLLRSVTHVRLDPAGIHLERLISEQSIAWDQIERVDRDKRNQLFGQNIKILNLVGRDGKTIAFIPDTIERFDDLANEVGQYSAFASGRTTYDPAESDQRVRAREAKNAKRTAVLGAVMLIVFGAIFVGGVYEDVHLGRYATEGVVTNAKITSRYMVRVTPYVEYSFRDDKGGMHSNKVMMDQDAWDALEGSTTIPVQYQRGDPEYSRLVSGQQEGSHLGGKFLFLSGGLTLFMLVMTVTLLLGYDLKSENGQFLIVKRGKILKTFGQPRIPQGAVQSQFSNVAIPQPADLPPFNLPPAAVPPVSATRRPPGIIALGILSFIFGGIGLLLGILRLVMIRAESFDLGNQSFVLDVSTIQRYWWLADGILAVLLMITGIGLLLLRRWGRKLGIAVSLLQLFSSVAGIVVAIIAISQAPPATGQESAKAAVAGVGAILGQVISAIFPLILFLILVRRGTAAVFKSKTPT